MSNPSIERTWPDKPGHASHLKRLGFIWHRPKHLTIYQFLKNLAKRKSAFNLLTEQMMLVVKLGIGYKNYNCSATWKPVLNVMREKKKLYILLAKL